MKKIFKAADLFCGAGGSSTGISLAAQECDMKLELLAVNHWELAVETHAANHPGTEHLCEAVDRIDPTKAVPGRRLNLLWASPECTHHSIARGGRPRSDQSRASAWLILKWLSELYVERVIIENVPEFLSWGPLDKTGHPIQNQKGKTFQAFIQALRSLGYSVDWKILCVAARPVNQPVPTVATAGAISLIEPFITRYQGSHEGRMDGDNRNHNIEKPLPTVDTSNRYGLVEPFMITVNHSGSDNRHFSLDKTMPTICAGGKSHGLVESCGLDIRFRMLKNHELKRAQGFPDDYKILGNTAEQTKQIGNAVPVNTAKALTMAIMER